MVMAKPLLSIGIIFKNEIRCLERCLKSLAPLREAVPCEVVMADTGSGDGSRMIAEKYADILFDFEWINDFAAARNAVMDRCSGKWFFCVDSDEWLGENIKELVEFVTTDHKFKNGGLIVRNYQSTDLDKGDDYSDFFSSRLILMSTGLRFVGAIHERWPTEMMDSPTMLILQKTILHHDGYVYIDAAAARKKTERNMELLRKHLEEDPENITTLLQCIESSDGTAECIDFIKKGVQAVEERWQGWKIFGAPILRYASVASFKGNLPELEKNIDLARELFPNSIYTRIDVEYAAFAWNWKRQEYKKCIESGERFLKGLADYEEGRYDRIDSLSSTLTFSASQWKTQVQIFMAASYLYEQQPSKAIEFARELNGEKMSVKHVGDFIKVYAHLHARTNAETGELLTQLWEQVNRPVPSEDRAKQRKNEFIRMGSEVFLPAYQKDEEQKKDFFRHSYTLFLPLRGKCVLGDMAAILETDNPETIKKILSEQEHYEQLSAPILFYALEHGVCLPLSNKPLRLEEMDGLIYRLAQDKERFLALMPDSMDALRCNDWQGICWMRGMLMAAVRTYPWADKERDEEQGMAIARAFARVEQSFLSVCYAPSALSTEGIFMLPPMHRFGWQCVQAFEALDSGDYSGCVQHLRTGLDLYQDVAKMVEFLLDQVEEMERASRIATAPPELMELAKQVQVMLARFEPDDPAVAELKRSPVYQQVAWLIEKPTYSSFGFLPQ